MRSTVWSARATVQVGEKWREARSTKEQSSVWIGLKITAARKRDYLLINSDCSQSPLGAMNRFILEINAGIFQKKKKF